MPQKTSANKKPELLVGTSSWTDKTLLATDWYPKEAKTAEQRLAYYASQFPLVEVDSSYYALPSEKNAALWVERTPAHFTFNVKAFSLMTQHPAQVRALPKDLRDAAGEKASVYARDLPASVIDEIFEMFRTALMPLHSAGKLGAILFQFPEWFTPAPKNKDYVLECALRLPDYKVAIEFRQHTWMDTDEHIQWTLDWLSENDLTYVCVDMPQGFSSSMPPVVAATSKDLAVVRFHGHNEKNWKRKGITVAERFDYLYSAQELETWAPRLFELAGEVKRTHVLFNNCYQDKGVRNAKQMADLLAQLV
ncbi:MAG: DUF72 domain-containing protein [Actinomycetota bacterium]